MDNTIRFNIDEVKRIQTELVEIKTQLRNKYDNDARIINDIAANIKSSEFSATIQNYITANETKSTQIITLFDSVDAFLTSQINAYTEANTTAGDNLTHLQGMLDNL